MDFLEQLLQFFVEDHIAPILNHSLFWKFTPDESSSELDQAVHPVSWGALKVIVFKFHE